MEEETLLSDMHKLGLVRSRRTKSYGMSACGGSRKEEIKAAKLAEQKRQEEEARKAAEEEKRRQEEEEARIKEEKAQVGVVVH